jgi:two-component system, chemotaxis family, CheB/CheR fusion protein
LTQWSTDTRSGVEPSIGRSWGLRADEVRNQNVFGLDIGLPIEQLRRPISASLTGENEFTELSLIAMNRRGEPIECKVTCTSLRGKTGH